MAVSKPLERAVRTVRRWLGLEPASTRQPATPVAPFQLAHTVVVPPRLAAAIAGSVAGVAFQRIRYARLWNELATKCPSNSSCPPGLNSLKCGSEPQPTK